MATIVAHLPQFLPTSEKELHTLLTFSETTAVRIYDSQWFVESDPRRCGTQDASRLVNELHSVCCRAFPV